MKRLLIVIASLSLLGLAAGDSFACDCAAASAPCQAFGEASAVFLGTVIDSRNVTVKRGNYDEQMRSVHLSIGTPFRGVEGAEVEVLTGFGGGDCGFGFVQSQQYLVYAYEFEGKLATGICTRTSPVSKADEDLAYLRGLPNARPGATIRGEVVRYRRNEKGRLDNEPLAGLTITVEGATNKEIKTDGKGMYRVEGLPAGEYLVRLSLPEKLSTRGEPEHKVKVMDRACAVASFWLEPDGQLSGRVLNPQGLPVNKAEIFLSAADKERYQGYWDAQYSDEEGRYSFKHVPPGRYVLAIRFDGMTSQQRPFLQTYYPGVSEKSQATVITIAEGQRFEKYDLQVPPLPLEYEVVGVVLWADGKPAPNASVGYGADAVSYAVKVDEQGRFTFRAYEGLKLGISAWVAPKNGKHLQSNGVTVLVGPGLESIKLILPNP